MRACTAELPNEDPPTVGGRNHPLGVSCPGTESNRALAGTMRDQLAAGDHSPLNHRSKSTSRIRHAPCGAVR